MHTVGVIIRLKAWQTNQASSNTDKHRFNMSDLTKHLQTIPNKDRQPWHTKQTSVFVGECLLGVPWALKPPVNHEKNCTRINLCTWS